MKKSLSALNLKLGHTQRRHVQLLLLVISLILFVLGAGASADWGGVGG